ncbi:MAG TPA: hypothetical protein VNB94_13865 [Mycobacteriales bacterium]|nr:hypothetical protein [Mycobacteriales bacterium]
MTGRIPDAAFEPDPALRLLVSNGVVFVLIGGLAARQHGSTTVTNDLDICYERSPENAERLAASLRQMRARLRGADEDVPFILDAQTIRNGDSFTFTTEYGSVDILATPSGTSGYPDLVAGAVAMDFGGYVVDVVALDDLIRMKRAAGRAKDRVEVEILIALRDLLTERGEL